MNPAAEVVIGSQEPTEELNEAALAVRAAAEARRDAPMQRRNILSVQGCSGCGRPRKQRVQTPFGMRSIFSRLKMTLIPGVEYVDRTHPRSGPKARRFPARAPLCKSCRQVALGFPNQQAAEALTAAVAA